MLFWDSWAITREDLFSGEMRWDAMTPPEYRDMDQLAVEQLKNTGSAPPWEKQFFRKDGSRVSVLIGATALTAASGEREAVSFVVDISERKQLERSCARRRRWRLLVSSPAV